MSFNINTAANAELKQKCEELNEEYKRLQTDVIEKWGRMFKLSEEYSKIKQLLDKREGRLNVSENNTEK